MIESVSAARRTIEPKQVEEEIDGRGLRVVTLLNEDYPVSLRGIFDPPAVLYYEGTIEEVDSLAVAVVGTRKPSAGGREIAHAFARGLAVNGVTVVSGLALGIDAAAHQGALEGAGRTIAVLGCGLDCGYPASNRELRRKIAGQGAVVSEFPPQTLPQKWHFPARNRVISGLSLGTLVVEAGEKSGALITADFALNENREVFAVPGSIRNPKAAGTNALIRDGATLVQSAQDICRALNISFQKDDRETAGGQMTLEDTEILQHLDDEGILVDRLVRTTGIPASRMTALLVRLETMGLVRRMPGNVYVRTRG
jgi:DNA processing protein